MVVQVITAENYYAPLLGLANSTRMGILNYDIDTVNQLQASSAPSLPPLGELTFESIKHNYSHLLEGLGELGEPLSLTLDPTIKPIQAAPHRYATPKLPNIKDAIDKLIHSGFNIYKAVAERFGYVQCRKQRTGTCFAHLHEFDGIC